MRGRSAVAAWAGLAAGAAVLGALGALLQRTLVPALEIRRYSDDIAAAVQAVAGHTDVAVELGRLRELTARLRGGAGAGAP